MSEVLVPLPHQPTMRQWADDHHDFGYFISPGMGKTAVTLQVMDDRMTDGRASGVLIICPLRVAVVTWPTQIKKWAHSSWMRVAHLRTPEGLKAWHDGSANVYLINPEMLPKLVPLMFKGKKTIPANMIVIDEVSTAKNPQSVRYNALRPYLNLFTGGRCILTGTPIPNTYLDLFAQIRLLDDGRSLGRSFHQYRQTFFTSDFQGFRWEIRPGAKEIIDAKVAETCLVMLGEDYLDVPTCSTEDVEVAMPAEAKTAYKTMEKELLLQVDRGEIEAMSAATLVMKLLQITSGSVYDSERGVHHIHSAKLDALKKLRKKHGKEPILVLVAFKHEAARVLDAIPGARMFDEKDMDAWMRGEIHTWVAVPQSLSMGIDGLQASCRVAIWMTLTYSNETYLQTNARIVRTGQVQRTIVYRLLISGTVDDAVAEALRTKSDTQSGLFNSIKALQQLRTNP